MDYNPREIYEVQMESCNGAVARSVRRQRVEVRSKRYNLCSYISSAHLVSVRQAAQPSGGHGLGIETPPPYSLVTTIYTSQVTLQPNRPFVDRSSSRHLFRDGVRKPRGMHSRNRTGSRWDDASSGVPHAHYVVSGFLGKNEQLHPCLGRPLDSSTVSRKWLLPITKHVVM